MINLRWTNTGAIATAFTLATLSLTLGLAQSAAQVAAASPDTVTGSHLWRLEGYVRHCVWHLGNREQRPTAAQGRWRRELPAPPTAPVATRREYLEPITTLRAWGCSAKPWPPPAAGSVEYRASPTVRAASACAEMPPAIRPI
jgi:hypothetical protein